MPPINELSNRIKERIQTQNRSAVQTEPGDILNRVNSSVQQVTKNIRPTPFNGAIKQSTPSNSGLVQNIARKTPSMISGGISAFADSETERRKRQSFGEEAFTDLVVRPAKILKAVGIDFPRLILGGISSVGKTIMETTASSKLSPLKHALDAAGVDTDTEAVRSRMKGDPKIEEILFKGETKSWQQIKENIDEAVRDSPIATNWEKQHLGLTLAVGGFMLDALPFGGGKGKLVQRSIKEMVEASDGATARQIMIRNNVPQPVADDAAEAIAKATSDQEVTNVLRQSSQNVLDRSKLQSGRTIPEPEAPVLQQRAIPKGGISRATDDTPAIKPEELPLMREAQKYKSAEEFVKAGAYSPARDSVARNEVRTAISQNTTLKNIDELTENPNNPPIDQSTVNIRAEDIKEGKRPYILVDESDQIIDGHHTYLAYKKEGIQDIPVVTKSELTDIYNRATKPQGMVRVADESPAFSTPTIIDESPEAVAQYKDARGKVAQSRDAFLEHVQDEMVRVRRLVNDPNLKITDASNPYDAEIRFHGRVGTRLESLNERVENIDSNIIKLSNDTGVPDGQLIDEVNEYMVARHAPERNAKLGDGAAGIKTADAQRRQAEIEKLPYFNGLKPIVDEMQQMNSEILNILKEGQVIDETLYDTLQKTYKSHVPLNRIMENEDDFAGAMARGFDVKDTGIKKAKGSNRQVNDILGNIVFNYEQALVRAEKNRVDLSTLKMVRDNEKALSDLFTVRTPKILGKTWDGAPIVEKVTDPKSLVLREKGKPVIIEIQDPSLAVALRGVNRHRLSGMMRGVGAITRLYSGIHTRFNPEFAFSNKIRDVQEVLVYAAAQGEVGGKGAAKIAARELRMQNMRAVTDFLFGRDSEGARLYKQMREDGGTTGGMGLSTRKEVEIDIQKIRKLNRSNPRKAAVRTLEYIDKWNQVFEDSSRLSVYRQAIENGASRERAAVLAKESSVNFNKFGRQGQYMNALWMFSNASVQGSTKMVRAMKNPKVAATVTTMVGGSVYAVNEWNSSVDPDWRSKVTTWDRLNSLAIMLPSSKDDKVQYVTIPVSWGVKPIKVMMDQIYDLSEGGITNLNEASRAVLVSILEAYNPVGGTDLISAVTPTILDMPNDLRANKAWHGGSIRPDWDRYAPDSIQYFDSLDDSTTGRTAIGIARGLSGIGMEISPNNLHYAYEQLIGGAGRTATKVINTLVGATGEDPLEKRDIPVISRFYRERPNEEIGQGTKEFQQIQEIQEKSSREAFYLDQQAEDSVQQLDNVPQERAAIMFQEIQARDPELAKRIVKIKKDKQKELTALQRAISRLGVSNGDRAGFLVEKFNKLDSDEERANLWKEYRAKGIISDEVAKQMKKLLSEN